MHIKIWSKWGRWIFKEVWLEEILRGVYDRIQVLSRAISDIVLKTEILIPIIINLVYTIDYKIYKIVLSD